MNVEVKVSRELLRNLNDLHDELFKKLKAEVVSVSLKNIQTPAKKRARVDRGRLRASINTRYGNRNVSFTYKDKHGAQFDGSLTGDPTDTKTRFECITGTNVKYGYKIERKYSFLEPAFLNALPILKRRLKDVIASYRP